MSAYLASKHDHFVCSICFECIDDSLAHASGASSDCNNDHDVCLLELLWFVDRWRSANKLLLMKISQDS